MKTIITGAQVILCAVVLSVFSLATVAQGPPVGARGLSGPASRAIDQMELASGGSVETTASSLTGLVSFVSTRPGFGIPLAARASDSPGARAFQFVQDFGKAFGLDSTDRVIVTTVSAVDVAGMEHVRLQQVIGGIPVTGGELTVHLRGATVVAVNAKTLPGLEDSVTIPAIPDGQAEEAVQAALLKYRGLVKAELTTPRLELFNRGLLEGIRYPTRLAWFVEATAPGVRDFYWIDAEIGGVLLNFSQLPHARQREIYDAENGATLPGTHIRSEGEAASGDADADLAYDYSGDTYDYFFTEHGRDSFDGAGATLTSSVHYCPDAEHCPYLNASWDGSQMRYGDGFASADDVVAHELTHAVSEYSANFFGYMQSGALNESYSDIFGETMDQGNAAGNDEPGVRWLMGEDVPVFGAIRDMMNPNTYDDPGKMSDPMFTCADPGDDAGGIHWNTGVPNHAYAMMVDGGDYNGLSIAGIGSTKAAMIQYRALTQYLLSASDFLDNANALRQSCTDLVGTAGISAADCNEVGDALDAVEMSDPWPCSPPQAVVPELCPMDVPSVDIFFDDLETIDSGQWITGFGSVGNHWVGGGGDNNLYTPGFATSGSYSFHGHDVPVAADSWVGMSFDLAIPIGDVRMQFAHSYGFYGSASSPNNGGILEYSTDGGSTWSDAGGLIVAGAAYGGTIYASHGNPLAGRNAFGGDSYGYTATQLDLSGLGGQNVRFRFHIGTGLSGGDYGWFIDDVRVYACAMLHYQLDSPGVGVLNVVPPGEAPWNIDGVVALGRYGTGQGPTPLLNVAFLGDAAGLPGVPLCTYTGLASGVDFSDSAGGFSVQLPSTCSLPAGAYWVSVQADMDFDPLGQWKWKTRAVQSGAAFAWQNPGDAFGTGCTSWTTGSSCIPDPDPDLLFSLWSNDVTLPTCLDLSLDHAGSGSDPNPLPIKSPGCAPGEFVAGASITLNATPAPGWEVVGWTGTDNNSSASMVNTVTMPASAHAASVAYEVKPCHTLTLGHNGAGTDPVADLPNSPACTVGSYHAGEVLALLAQPAEGQVITAWSGTDNDASLTLANTLTMPAASHVVTASYGDIPAGCYLLVPGHSGQGLDPVLTPANSPACPGGTYTAGETVLLEAFADDEWTVGGWTGTDDDGSFLWLNSLNMPAGDHSVTARYMTPKLVKDIRPGNLGAFDRDDGSLVSYTTLSHIGSTLFFAANDGVHGIELWKSDGTPGGTSLVKDIWPGAGSAFPGVPLAWNFDQSFFNLNGTLFFVANDGVHGYELWKSDGTAPGTTKITDGNYDWNEQPEIMGVIGDSLFFSHIDDDHGIELWKTDGSEAGTRLIKDINAGANGSNPTFMGIFGDLLVFIGYDPVSGGEPWISDGTTEGTLLLKDIRTDGNSVPGPIAEVGGVFYFAAQDDAVGRELWKSDGTTDGTVLLKDIYVDDPPFPRGSDPLELTEVGGTLLFRAQDGIGSTALHGSELWMSDGTEEGTDIVKDIWPGTWHSWPRYLTEVSGILMFKANSPDQGDNGGELWRSDGTQEGTYMVKDTWPGANPINYWPQNLMSIGGSLMFLAADPAAGNELWRSDGTQAGTARVADINPGPSSSSPNWMIDADGVLFFRASDGTHGREVWVLRDDSRCHALTLNHTGQGADPVPDPVNSLDCDPGFFEEGEVVTLTASPDPDWTVGSWSGSDNDGSTSTVNSVTMPAVDHALTVHYSAPDLIFAHGFE